MIHPTAKIHPSAVVHPDCVIGEGCVVREGAIIGAYGLALEQGHKKHKPMRGKVVLGKNVDVGANAVIHRGVTRDTTVGDGTFIGSLCNIGHDVRVGSKCLIINMALICGYVEIGNGATIAAGCTIRNRVKIGPKAFVGIGSLALEDVVGGTIVYGRPARRRTP